MLVALHEVNLQVRHFFFVYSFHLASCIPSLFLYWIFIFYILSLFVLFCQGGIKILMFLQNLFISIHNIHNIVGQPLPYFEKFVSKEDIVVVNAKQKSKHIIWFILDVEVFNGFLYQAICFKISVLCAYFFHYLYISFVFVVYLDFYYQFFCISFFIMYNFYILICFFLGIARIRRCCCYYCSEEIL